MPLSAFQKQVLLLLGGRRTPESYAGGGAAINRDDQSPRFSSDLDFFHDAEESVRICAEGDAETLRQAGYEVRWLQQSRYIYQAKVAKNAEHLGLDWCLDSAFRFFPITPDPQFGYCLHPMDLATNKMLALAGRSKIRDYIDIVYLHQQRLSLGALCWAACGKDPGFNPFSLLEMAKRHVSYRQEELDKERLSRQVTLPELKQVWLRAAEEAEALFQRLPAEDMGCLYLDASGNPVTPKPDAPEFKTLTRHFGSVRGAWPTLTDLK